MLGKRGRRLVATCLLVLGALALAVPAATLAAGGGGSAGDNQYTDPFANSHSATSATATSPAPATTSSSPATVAPTTTSAPPAPTPTVSTPAPTATLATGTAGATPRTLPYTGFDGLLAGALGVGLITGGAALRRRSRVR